MKLASKQMVAEFTARISSGRRSRRRSLNMALPAPADLILESRLMLDGGDPIGGGGVGMGSGNTPPQLTVTVLAVPDTVVNGDVVGNASATDLDGDAITFYFEGGTQTDPSGTFAIDATSGVITVANADNIGSQDESDDSPLGWSFTAMIVASDGVDRGFDISHAFQLAVERTKYRIKSPEDGAELVAGADLVVQTTRAKGVKVRVQLLMKMGDDYVRPTFPGVPPTDRVAPGNPAKTTATFEFGPGTVGEYRLDYSYWTRTGWQPAQSVYFTVKPR